MEQQLEGNIEEQQDADAMGEQNLPPPADHDLAPAPQLVGHDDIPAPIPAVMPQVPPHLLGPNVGVVLPIIAPPHEVGAGAEVDPNLIELD
jgi:hypothetical protein